MKIKTTKGTFKMIPEGDQTLFVKDVKLVPAGRPQYVEFYYEHADGGNARDRLDLNHPIAVSILGKRMDVALKGEVEEGTEFELEEVIPMFKGKYVKARVEHNKVGDKTYANIKYIAEVWEEEDDL